MEFREYWFDSASVLSDHSATILLRFCAGQFLVGFCSDSARVPREFCSDFIRILLNFCSAYIRFPGRSLVGLGCDFVEILSRFSADCLRSLLGVCSGDIALSRSSLVDLRSATNASNVALSGAGSFSFDSAVWIVSISSGAVARFQSAIDASDWSCCTSHWAEVSDWLVHAGNSWAQ